jgi:hypothetical protein
MAGPFCVLENTLTISPLGRGQTTMRHPMAQDQQGQPSENTQRKTQRPFDQAERETDRRLRARAD